MASFLWLVVAVFVTDLALLAQQTWKVDCLGAPGSHFMDIPPAVAAAAPGDTLLVYYTAGPGFCGKYTAPFIDKPLRIIGFKVGLAGGSNIPFTISMEGSLQVANIPAGQQVLITNVAISHWPYGPVVGGSPITITDCAGSVVLENIIFDNYGVPQQLIKIERCDHVVVRGSAFVIAGDPIRIIDSNVLFTNTIVYDTYPLPFWGAGYTMTTESLRLVRSTVTLSGSIVLGARNWGFGLPQRSAATLDNSTLRIGASCTFRGGRFPGTVGPWLGNFIEAYQVVAGPSVVEVDPRVPAFNYPPASPPVATPIHETFHDWVVADEWFNVRVLGPQGGFALLTIGNMAFPTLSPFGLLGVDLASVYPIELVPLTQPDGFYSWTFFCPSLAPVDFAFALQTATISPTGTIALTTPSPLVPAWDKTRIP